MDQAVQDGVAVATRSTPPVSERYARVALAGNPNCGKTALFNALTRGRQKVGNYPGVTVERKEGTAKTPAGRSLSVLDLPGAYSLDARSPDEEVTRDVLLGTQLGEEAPDALIAVADATNLERCLGLVLEVRDLGIPAVLALNMMDLARERELDLDISALQSALGIPVIPTVAPKSQGTRELLASVEGAVELARASGSSTKISWRAPGAPEIRQRFTEVDRILALAIKKPAKPTFWTDRIDGVVLHPFWGSLILLAVLAIMFQAIFTWASTPMDWIEGSVAAVGNALSNTLSEGPLRSLLVDGIIAGVGSILVFLPQILLLFTFILILEDSGYMARAAFLMDRTMGRVGLHGRAFIPLLSSFACTVPGIMATRTIENRRDRLTTILVAPLITCSARLPVYSLLIAAFIPNQVIWGPVRMQGAVMLGLYLSGIFAALLVASILRKTVFSGPKPALMLQLPTYKWPDPKNVMLGLLERASIFIKRAGTVILALSILIWFLASYPKPPADAPSETPGIAYSFAGQIGKTLEPIVQPIGFNWQIAVAMIPGFAAREVMVGALATVYAVEGDVESESGTELLASKISRDWPLATALSLLVWYVLSLQCLSTLAVTRRETNSWKWPAVMLGYMTVLAYTGSFVTYRLVLLMERL
ncbi:MAG: ferrous iron transport protein B [Bdellovibrionales bacterium GWB1_55_8]|nr:MAG: ferrous iron transport protein B [Bdellovibrionales bacterium GWB1_55_8]